MEIFGVRLFLLSLFLGIITIIDNLQDSSALISDSPICVVSEAIVRNPVSGSGQVLCQCAKLRNSQPETLKIDAS